MRIASAVRSFLKNRMSFFINSDIILFEVEENFVGRILKSFKNANYQDQKVSVELAQPKDTDRKDSGRRDFKKRDDKKSGSKFKGKRRS